jgi:two-component system chemotaxis sensor kinase CheA
VSKLVGQRELVTRPLPSEASSSAAVSGAAVLSNGDIVLLADCDDLHKPTTTTLRELAAA